MAHPTVSVFGYSEAAMYLRGQPQPNVIGLVSIHGRREFGVEANVASRLDLEFDDVDVAPADNIQALQKAMARRRWAAQNGLEEMAPTRSDAEKIIDFARKLDGRQGTVLCHCAGGMSRAPAAALICLSVWRRSGSETTSVADILSLRPGASPHAGLIGFADELLGREGRLTRALLAAQKY